MKQWNQFESWLSTNLSIEKDEKLKQFIAENDFLPTVTTKDILDEFFRQADSGLNTKSFDKKNFTSSLLMGDSHICVAPSKDITELLPAVIVDAGGTNLRIVGAENKDGQLFFSSYEKKRMPGIEKTITAEDFFYQLSLLISPILKKAPFNTLQEIKFCFSYPFYIDENGEARVISLTKEISIENIRDVSIDAMLKKNINAQLGEEKIKSIAVLNDTVATLLASYTKIPMHHDEMLGKRRDTRLGLVLGTGLNMAYQEWRGGKYSVINTEIGSYDQLCHTIIDRKIDELSTAPGKGLLEKCVSGAYLGQWIYECLLLAFDKGLLKQSLATDKPLKVEEISRWLAGDSTQTLAGHLVDPQSDDGQRIKILLEMAVFRSASLAATATYAIVKWATRNMEKSNDESENKVVLSLNGSVITKTHRYLETYKKNLEWLLLKENNTKISFVDVEHSPTIGSIYAKKMH